MSFRPLSPRRSWSGTTAAVRCAVAQTKKGAVLRLILSAALLKKHEWEDRTHFFVQVGEDDSAGRLRVSPATIADSDAFVAGKLPHKAGFRLTLHGVPGLPDFESSMRDCLHAPSADMTFVEIVLPPFNGSPASKSAAAAASAPPKPAAAKAGGAVGPLRAPPLRMTIASELLTILSIKAGIAFGCTRQEIFNPLDEAAIDAQACVAMWLRDHRYAESAITKALKLGAFAEVDAAAAGITDQPARMTKRRRFETLVDEAMKHGGMAA